MIAVLLAAALAAECRWPTPPADVYATPFAVKMEGVTLPARGVSARVNAAAQLRDCGWNEAADELTAWRRSRRATNVWTAVGCFTVWGFLPIAMTAPAATAHREAMLLAIHAGR